MYAVKRSVYQGSDGVQVDSVSQVKTFDDYKEAEKVAENCGGRVVKIVKGQRPRGKPIKNNQKWMREKR